MIRLLLYHGANPNQDVGNLNAFKVAITNPEILKILEPYRE
jgi:hypothetical protein